MRDFFLGRRPTVHEVPRGKNLFSMLVAQPLASTSWKADFDLCRARQFSYDLIQDAGLRPGVTAGAARVPLPPIESVL